MERGRIAKPLVASTKLSLSGLRDRIGGEDFLEPGIR